MLLSLLFVRKIILIYPNIYIVLYDSQGWDDYDDYSSNISFVYKYTHAGDEESRGSGSYMAHTESQRSC